jgi:hypothetical protein
MAGLGSAAVFVADHISHVSDGMDQFSFEWVINLGPELPDINVDYIGQPLKALVPNVLNDHRSRQNATGVHRQVFQQRVLFGSESN